MRCPCTQNRCEKLKGSSYNLINGTQSCENDQSMNRILKDELGFQGLYVHLDIADAVLGRT